MIHRECTFDEIVEGVNVVRYSNDVCKRYILHNFRCPKYLKRLALEIILAGQSEFWAIFVIVRSVQNKPGVEVSI